MEHSDDLLNTGTSNEQVSFMERLLAYCVATLLTSGIFMAIVTGILYTTQSYFSFVDKTIEQFNEMERITLDGYKQAILSQYVEHGQEYKLTELVFCKKK